MGLTQFNTSSGSLIEGLALDSGTIDFNGTADCIILDADGDTTISSPTDDQIDIEIGGADDFTFTSNSFNVLDGSVIGGASSNFFFMSPVATQQNLSGAGAINLTTHTTFWTTTSTDAGTLADGKKGQFKRIVMTVDGGDGTLTPSNLSGGTTITFSAIGDTAELYFNGSGWIPINLYNMATGAITTPVLA